MNDLIENLKSIAQEKYNNGDPSHDFAHVSRVVNSCRKLGLEAGADLDVLIPAAYLHDIVNVPKNHPDRKRASELCAVEASRILLDLGLVKDQVARVAECIVEHSYSLGRAPSSLEAAILQDADRLDALGAIGILRMATVGAKLGRSFYNPVDPFAREREPNDQTNSVDHFQTKLFKLHEKMNTKSAKEEAIRRTEFMRDFLLQLEREI